MDKDIEVFGKTYHIIRLLGHGKGGYSYLAEANGHLFVAKRIHHEPCDYYSFGNKIEAERRDYHRLQKAGIRVWYDADGTVEENLDDLKRRIELEKKFEGKQ